MCTITIFFFKFLARSENVCPIFCLIRLATKPECERCSRIIVVHGKIERDICSEWIFKVNFAFGLKNKPFAIWQWTKKEKNMAINNIQDVV